MAIVAATQSLPHANNLNQRITNKSHYRHFKEMGFKKFISLYGDYLKSISSYAKEVLENEKLA